MPRWLRWLLVALGVVVVLLGAVAGIAYWQARSVVAELQAGPKHAIVTSVEPELHRQPRHHLAQLPPEPGAETILLIGSDHRYGWSGGESRSDTIILVRIEPAEHRIALLSIPRDLYVAIPGHGHDRINEAYHDGGEKLLTHVVRETFGVEIDHFVEVDFHGFKGLVAALGGIYVPVDERYYNENVGTAATNYASIDLEPGYQKLDGAQALAFARYRHTDSDLVRAARQQLVLRVAAHAALSGGWNPFRIRNLAEAFAKATASDISSLSELIGLARAVEGTPAGNVVDLTVPVSDFTLDGADYLRSTKAQLRTTVERWFGDPKPSSRGSHRRTPERPSSSKSHRAAPVQLAADSGARVLAGIHPEIRTCTPTALPPGYQWLDDAGRSYLLAGHPAVALYASAGFGRDVLWMFTTWHDPPILGTPAKTVHHGGRAYDLYTTGGKLREIAWRIGPTQAWITNTLQSTLSNGQLLALAESCR